MPAYVIVFQESTVRDAASLADYQRLASAAAAGFQLTPRVVYGAIDPLEGRPPAGVVVLEFPSLAEARAWYDSPAYQAALPHRQRAADYRAIIVQGV